jgi:hypothetical protein
MGQLMSTIQGTCGTCKHPVDLNIGEGIDGARLVWHSSYVCANCGAQVVMDDDGFPPSEIRDQLTATNGYWETVVEVIEEPLRLVTALCGILGINRIDAFRLSKSLPGRLSLGTRVECEWIRQQLAQQGIQVSTREVAGTVVTQ